MTPERLKYWRMRAENDLQRFSTVPVKTDELLALCEELLAARAALEKIAALSASETDEPLDDAIAIACGALAGADFKSAPDKTGPSRAAITAACEGWHTATKANGFTFRAKITYALEHAYKVDGLSARRAALPPGEVK